MVNPRGAPPAHNFLNFMQFSEILVKLYVGAPPTGNPGYAPDYEMPCDKINAGFFSENSTFQVKN